MRILLLSFFSVLILPFNSFSQWAGTVTLDGDVTAGEGYVTSGQYSMAWDDDYLYIRYTGGSASEPCIVYLDVNPINPVDGGSNADGNLTGVSHWGITPTLPFRADFHIYWESNYAQYQRANGSGGWNSFVTIGTSDRSNTSGSNREIRLSWVNMMGLSGRPTSFNWFAYCNNTSCCPAFIFHPTPTENPTGNQSTPTINYYWTVSSTDNDANITNPFSRRSFESRANFTLSTANTFWDFTVNGGTLTNTANHTINNQLYVVSGTLTQTGARTLTFGSASTHTPTLRCDGTINPNNGVGNDLICTFAQGTTTLSGTASDANFRLFNINVNSGATLQAPSSGTVNLGLQFGTFTNNGTVNFVNGSGVVNVNVVNNGTNTYSFSNTSGTVNFNNLTISTSATFRPINTGTHSLNIRGNLVNTPGTYSTTNGSGLLHTTFNGTTAQTISAAQTFQNLTIANTSATVTMNGALTIASGRTMTIDPGARFDLGVQNLTLTGATCNVNGFFRRGGATNPTLTGVTAATLSINNGGTYEHNFTTTGGTIPTANWATGSTIAFIGYTTNTSNPGGLGQTFHHVIYNCPSQTSNLNFSGNLTTINGNLEVISTGTGTWRLTGATALNLNIGQNFVQSGGTLIVSTGTSDPANVNVSGNFEISGGTLDLKNGSTTGATNLQLEGNFLQTGGSIIRTSGNVSTVIFRKPGSISSYAVQNVEQTGGAIGANVRFQAGESSPSYSQPTLASNFALNNTGGQFTVMNGSALDFDNFVLTGNTFTQNSGGRLITKNVDGFESSAAIGSVQTTTRNFNAGGEFVYNGSSSQNLGNVITAADRVEVDNASGVTLNANVTTNNLVLTNGRITLGSHHLAISSDAGGAISGHSSSRYIITNSTGELRRAIATSSLPINYEFPIGTATAYTPAQFNFTANSASRNLHVRTVGNRNPNDVTTNDYIDNRYWVTDLSNSTGTYNYTSQFTFLPGDVVGSASNIRLNRWNGTAWSQPGGSSVVGNNLVSGSLNQSIGNLAATSEWAGRVVGPQTYTWTGDISSDWDEADNWDLGVVPGNPLDNIIIPSTYSNALAITGSRSANHFTVNPSATFSLQSGASLSISGDYNYNSTVAATFACNSSLSLSSSASQTIPAADYGNLNIAGGPRVLASSGTIRICGNYVPTAGTLTATGSTVEFNGSAAQSITTNNTSFNILNITNTSANVTSSVNLTITNQLNVNANARLDFGSNTLTITGATATINGFLRSAGTITGANTSSLIFTSTGTYEHNHPQSGSNLGTIPTATWNSGSTCAIIGLTNPTAGSWFSPASSAAQSFSNFTWNTPSLSTNPNMGGATLSVGGTFTLESTGSAELRMGTGTNGVINCANYVQSGGTLNMSNGSGNGTINCSGDFTHTGGTITETGTGTAHVIRFQGTSAQNINFSGTISNDINYEFDNPAGFTVSGTAPVANNRTVTRISGDLSGSGAFSYGATGTALIFNGSGSFSTSDVDFPASNGPVNLTIDGSAQVNLHANRSLPASGTLNLANGRMLLGNHNFTLLNNTAAAIAGTFSVSNMIITDGTGRLLRTIATTGLPITYLWPIGENTGVTEYSPVSITFSANSTSRQIGFNVIDAQHPENNNPLPQTNYLTRYWTASNSAAGTYSYTGTFNYVAADVNGTESLIKLNMWNGSGWTEAASTAASNQLTLSGTETQATLPFGATAEFTGRVNPILYFQSVATGDWSSPSTWEVADNPSFTGAAPATFPPNSSNSLGIWIRNGHTVTINSNVNADDLTIDAGGVLTVSSSGNLTITDGIATLDFVANGVFNINGTCSFSSGAEIELNDQVNVTTNTFTSAATVTVGGSAVYNHNVNGGSIVTATWSTGSKLEITGITTSNLSGGLGQLFWDVEWNCPGQAQAINVAAAPFNTIANDFFVTNTNGFELRFFSGNTGGTVNINRDLIVNGGLLALAAGASVSTSTVTVNVGRNVEINSGRIGTAGSTNTTAATLTFNIAGDLTLNGGNLNFLPGSFTIAANHTVNLSGNLTINSGQILRTGTLTANFRFNRSSGIQTYTASTPASAISTNVITWIVGNGTTQPVVNLASNFQINNSATVRIENNARLNCVDNNIITGGTFQNNLGGTLGIGSPQGIVTAPTASGSVQTNTRTFGTNSGYYYIGSANQVFGNGIPTTVARLGLETANGVQVTHNRNAHIIINNNFDLVSGILVLTTHDIQLQAAGTLTGAPFSEDNMVVNTGTNRYSGRFMKLYPVGSFTGSFTYPMGDITGTIEYSPVSVNISYTGATTAPYLTFKCVDSKHPLDPSIDDYLTRHWESTANWYSATGTVSAQFTYLPADIVGNESNIKHNRFSWSGITAGNFFEDAGSSASGNVLSSVVMPLGNVTDHDHLGRLTVPLYFRSNVTSGLYELNTSWLVSSDINFVSPPGQVPSIFPFAGNSDQIRIMDGHTITYNSTAILIDQTVIDDGGNLVLNSGSSLRVVDGPGVDLLVNGTLTRVNIANPHFPTLPLPSQQPTFGTTGTLVYQSGTGSPGLEWTGNSTTPGLGIPNNVTIAGATLNMPAANRGMAGSLLISSGTLNLNSSSGNLFVGGNWTRANTATFNANNRSVYFNGSSDQTMTILGGGTEFIPRVFINKTGGDFILNDAPATNLTITTPSFGGVIFEMSGGGNFNLNGNSLNLTNPNFNDVHTVGANHTFTGGAGSTINVGGGAFKTITSTSGGTFTFGPDVTVNLAHGLNFGANLSTLQGTLNISSGGFVQINPPIYGSNSTLRYATGGSYNVSSEWTEFTDGPAAFGRPNHVVVQSSTVNMPIGSRGMAGDLTINATLNFNSNVGSDLFIRGNIINNGTLNTNNRQVSFTGVSGMQSISGTAATTFDFFEINNPDGVELQRNITIDDRLLFTNGQMILNDYNLTHNRAFNPAFQGADANKYVVTNGTGRLIQQVGVNNVDFPIGPSTTSYNPMLINQQGTAEQIGIRAAVAPPFSHALNDQNQMVNVEYNINESVNGANSIFTQFNWNGFNEAAGFVRTSGVFHGHWNGTEWVVRPSSATTGSDPYQSNSTVNFTGTLGSGGTNFAVGNINAFFSCILTQAAGNWENPSTWVPGVVPPSDASVCVSHPIVVNAADAEISNVTINAGGEITIQPTRTLTIMNNGALINNSGAVADLGSGTLRFNGIGSTSGSEGITLNNLQINGNTSLNTTTTINGNLTINLSSFIVVGTPEYGPSATLIYNASGNYSVSNEWTGNSLVPGAGIPFNVIIQNGTTVNMPSTDRGFGGNLNIDNGTLTLHPTSGDLFIGGNWTRNNATGTFTPNGRAVYFNGNANQTISITGGGAETFTYLIVDKPGGNLIISAAPATDVNVTANVGNALQILNNGGINLNGRTLSMLNNGGNILVSGGVRNISGGPGSVFAILGNKTTTSAAGGTLVYGSDVTVALSAGLNCGANLSTVEGTLQIAPGGFVNVNPPTYAVGSTLRYFTGNTYNRGTEWSALSGPGYPHHVVIDFNGTPTTLNLLGASSALRRIAGNLTINDGGNLNMGAMSHALEVLGNVTIGGGVSGSLTLGTFIGGDMLVGGNLVRNNGATLTQNSREVVMNGSSNQSILNVAGFDYLAIANTGIAPNNQVTLTANTTINNRLRLSNGVLNLNAFNVIMANASEILRTNAAATMTAEPTVIGADQYDVRYTATLITGNEFSSAITAVRDLIIDGNITPALGGNRTFNRDMILAGANFDLNGFTLTARGRTLAPAFSGSITVSGGGTRVITGPAGSRFDITGLGANNPTHYTKTVSTFGGTLLRFDSNVLVRLGDGSVDFGAGNPTTIDGVLQILLGGSVGQILNPCYYGVNSILRFANTVDYIVHANDKTWAAGAINSGLPGIPYNVEVLDVGTDLRLESTRALRGNLTIIDGTFTIWPTFVGSFNIGGNWTRTGITSGFTHNQKKVVFDGLLPGNQLITVGNGVTTEVFYDLEIAAALGNISLGPNTNVEVINNLNFVSGNLDLNNTLNKLTIGTAVLNGSITGFNANRYIISQNGKIVMHTNLNGVYSFPFGDANNYTPFEITLNQGAQLGAYITASMTLATHPNINTLNTFEYIMRYWDIVPTGLINNPLPNYDVRYSYAAVDEVGSNLTYRAVKYSYINPTPGWIASPGGPANAIEGTFASHDPIAREFVWQGLFTFSSFTGAGDGSPLPVTLLDFNAQPVNNEVLVTWTTASEINNDYFQVERSRDAVNYEVVGIVQGAGNSNQVLNYSLIDKQPLTGISYYRLRQVDFNGDFELFDPVAVFFGGQSLGAVTVFPNPAKDVANIKLETRHNDHGLLQLFNIAGAMIWQKNINAVDGINNYQLDISDLPAGQYILTIRMNRTESRSLPLVITR